MLPTPSPARSPRCSGIGACSRSSRGIGRPWGCTRGEGAAAAATFAANAAFYRASGSTHRAALAHANQALALADLDRIAEAKIAAELSAELSGGASGEVRKARGIVALVELVTHGPSPELRARARALEDPRAVFADLVAVLDHLEGAGPAPRLVGSGVWARLLGTALALHRPRDPVAAEVGAR